MTVVYRSSDEFAGCFRSVRQANRLPEDHCVERYDGES